MPDFLSNLIKAWPALSRGVLINVIVVIMGGFSYFYLWHFLPHQLRSDPYEELHHAFQFSFLSVSFSVCILMSFWALAMTYLVGPGFCRQVFKSVHLDPINEDEQMSLINVQGDDDNSTMLVSSQDPVDGDEPNSAAIDANPNEGMERKSGITSDEQTRLSTPSMKEVKLDNSQDNTFLLYLKEDYDLMNSSNK